MFVLSRGHAPVTLSEQVAKKKSYVLEYNSADLVFHELKIRGKFKRHSFVDLHEALNVPFLGIPCPYCSFSCEQVRFGIKDFSNCYCNLSYRFLCQLFWRTDRLNVKSER